MTELEEYLYRLIVAKHGDLTVDVVESIAKIMGRYIRSSREGYTIQPQKGP